MSGEAPVWKRYEPPSGDAIAAELEREGLSEAEGWRRYNAAIEEVRQLILTSPLTNHDPQTRAEALAILPQIQAQAYTMIVAPRQDFPRLYVHEYFHPGLFTWNLPNPDFFYRTTFLDGRRRYRLFGKRGAGAWVEFECRNCFNGVGSAAPDVLGSWSLDDLECDAAGAFEIQVAAEKQPGNWIPIDPGSRNNWLLVRELVYPGETPGEMRVDVVGDGPPRMMALDERELGRRLALGGEMVKYVVTRMTYARVQEVVLEEAGGTNAFHSVIGKAGKDSKDGTHPMAVYQICVYEIEPDEALILEVEPPPSHYWGVHLGDILNQTRDFVLHATSLNDRTAVRDANGRVRVVMCTGDPGVPNWLDAMGSVFGRLVWRWYGAQRQVTPSIRRVKRADVRRHLPRETPLVTAADRARQLSERLTFYSGLYDCHAAVPSGRGRPRSTRRRPV